MYIFTVDYYIKLNVYRHSSVALHLKSMVQSYQNKKMINVFSNNFNYI